MAKQINKTNVVTISAVDYSSQISSVTVQETVEELDTTCMGDSAKRREAGLKDGSVTINFKPNTDLTNLHTISALLGTVVAVTHKSDDGAIAAGNPEQQFNALVTQAPSWGGGVGTVMESSVTWPLDTVVTYDVTP
ncbi:MAG: radical SAM protein [Gemmatimonadetes bacterium]|nr:radical SAM protein [Gemmatimonadota bacterium]